MFGYRGQLPPSDIGYSNISLSHHTLENGDFIKILSFAIYEPQINRSVIYYSYHLEYYQ